MSELIVSSTIEVPPEMWLVARHAPDMPLADPTPEARTSSLAHSIAFPISTRPGIFNLNTACNEQQRDLDKMKNKKT